MKHIVCFHLYNDFSGSPKVLKMVIEGLCARGIHVSLVSSRGGVLDELQNIDRFSYSYKFSTSPILTFIKYIWVQFLTFIVSFRYLFSKDVVFYINTILPIGPAVAGWIMRKKVVYHYHENAATKGTFYIVLCWLMQKLATEIICVSKYQASFLQRDKNVTVILNCLPKSFKSKLIHNSQKSFENSNVLMLSSLKEYKGTMEFISLAKKLPQFKFSLVINDTQENIDIFAEKHQIEYEKIDNLSIYARQDDVSRFYNDATVVLNLSNKKMFVETFGLTALEAMSAGLPVIVPTVGGIAEIVEHGITGYKIDVEELDLIANQLQFILTDKKLFMELSKNALSESERYNENAMINKIMAILS